VVGVFLLTLELLQIKMAALAVEALDLVEWLVDLVLLAKEVTAVPLFTLAQITALVVEVVSLLLEGMEHQLLLETVAQDLTGNHLALTMLVAAAAVHILVALPELVESAAAATVVLAALGSLVEMALQTLVAAVAAVQERRRFVVVMAALALLLFVILDHKKVQAVQ
jgi:hypothetical protein